MINGTNHGLTSENVRMVEDIFRRHIPVGAKLVVWIFGSRAKGTHSRYSDVDLLIECAALPTDALSNITESLEESPLPYKFDLVDSAKLAPEYAHSVHASKHFLFSL